VTGQRVTGKVAFITGAARGQGRSHAIRLALEGADIIAVDICADVPTVPYPGSAEADLAETAKLVEALDRRVIARKADVRDYASLKAALDEGVAELGRLDIVCANAGIFSHAPTADLTEQQWGTMIDINLSGVWRTCKAAIPRLIEGGRGGSIIITSSVAGLKGQPQFAHYVAAKHGLTGLMRTLALELAPHSIRVNTINPGNVNTPMVQNEDLYRLFLPDSPNPTREQFEQRLSGARTMLPAPYAEAADISNTVLFLASDEGRYVTGVTLPVDLGAMVQ
jgi:SDR family mycofactocin-dependent oxidoreductase